MKTAFALIPASFLMAGSALAQEAPPAQQQAAPPAAEAAPAPPASADVSDEEVSQFALAALVVEQIAADEAMAQEEKQNAMMGAVQQAGLEPQRFNQIAVGSQSDAELSERIQLAANEHIEAAQAQSNQ